MHFFIQQALISSVFCFFSSKCVCILEDVYICAGGRSACDSSLFPRSSGSDSDLRVKVFIMFQKGWIREKTLAADFQVFLFLAGSLWAEGLKFTFFPPRLEFLHQFFHYSSSGGRGLRRLWANERGADERTHAQFLSPRSMYFHTHTRQSKINSSSLSASSPPLCVSLGYPALVPV